ncbi:2OG-Fe(II) oxygenase [Aquimonas voraii]|uniref:2OG-Fe(II) oxygenase superfamily protein n=1 Tax=Aquimonas voraii TaxID=265719 RepID=A0A1G6UZF3_9GAMM|nr:2OG-Fe(II) oxygenase [Aquimonas voraii]SDD46644.1 2OG-Fe(II) oxygenase superfamily protein [Aquimonas voraii]
MSLVNSSVLASSDALALQFSSAEPFRHVVIEDFLKPAFCEQLLKDFPGFEERYALNEHGAVGGKAVRMDVRDISEAYRQLDAYIQTPEFLGLVSRITGIPDLLYDVDYVGGGTHENVHGQSLDAHIDFNYHPGTRWHRRLNLIIYLNPEWQDAWGGSLELQSDPWAETGNTVKAIAPLFNRCAIFETNEISWHGFRRIELPEARRNLSRKSFAIYLYTRERPAQETAPSHATVYVPDAMPEAAQIGSTLTEGLHRELSQRFANLRGQLKFLYEREQDFARQIQSLEHALSEARNAAGFPLQGYAVLIGGAQGYRPDGWCSGQLEVGFEACRAASGISLDVWVPEGVGPSQTLVFECGDYRASLELASGRRHDLRVPLRMGKADRVRLSIRASSCWQPARAGDSQDQRELAWKLVAAQLLH